MARHAAFLRATPEELDAAIRAMRIDPSFPPLLHFCRRRRVDLTIVSDGFDRVLRAVLECAGCAFHSLPTAWNGRAATAGAWRFPMRDDDCRSQGGNCKCSQRPAGRLGGDR